MASTLGNVSVPEVPIEGGANVSLGNTLGMTPLHEAVERGQSGLVKVLI